MQFDEEESGLSGKATVGWRRRGSNRGKGGGIDRRRECLRSTDVELLVRNEREVGRSGIERVDGQG